MLARCKLSQRTIASSKLLYRTAFTLMVSIALIAGCEPEKTSNSQKMNVLAPVDGMGSNFGKSETGNEAISEVQALELAVRWVKAIETKNEIQMELFFDWNGVVDRSIQGMNLSDDFVRMYKKGAKQKLMAGILESLSLQLEGGGSYSLVRIVQRSGAQHAVFRLVGKDRSINYHDLQISRFGNSIRADRYFIASTGEELADTLRTLVGPALLGQASFAARITGRDKKALDGVEKQSKMMNAAKLGHLDEAKRLYNLLPVPQKYSKASMLTLIMATDVSDQEAYLLAIDNYVKRFPNDPAVGIHTLGAGILRNDPDLVEKSRKCVQDWTGGDEFLDLFVGEALANMGKVEEAIKLTQNIEPDSLQLAVAHDFKLSIALAAKDYPRVLRELMALRDEYDCTLDDLRKAEGFEGFVSSPEFGKWVGQDDI